MSWTVESLIISLYAVIFSVYLVLYLWIRTLYTSQNRVLTQMRDLRVAYGTLLRAVIELQEGSKPPQVTSLKNMPKISIVKDEG